MSGSLPTMCRTRRGRCRAGGGWARRQPSTGSRRRRRRTAHGQSRRSRRAPPPRPPVGSWPPAVRISPGRPPGGPSRWRSVVVWLPRCRRATGYGFPSAALPVKRVRPLAAPCHQGRRESRTTREPVPRNWRSVASGRGRVNLACGGVGCCSRRRAARYHGLHERPRLFLRTSGRPACRVRRRGCGDRAHPRHLRSFGRAVRARFDAFASGKPLPSAAHACYPYLGISVNIETMVTDSGRHGARWPTRACMAPP